jgi:hypothetical protein
MGSNPSQSSTSLHGEMSWIQDAWAATEQAIDSLHFMAAAIRRSSVQSEKYILSSRFERDDELCFQAWAKLLVKREFPNARRSLCEHLGASIATRRKRLFHKKLHEEKLGERRKVAPALPRPQQKVMVSTSTPQVSPSQLDTRPPPLPLIQRLKAQNNRPTGSDDTRSRLEGTAARKRIKGGPSFSTISMGSSVQNSTIPYPEMPQVSAGDKFCPCPYCRKPLEAGKLKIKDPKYWK